MIIFIAIAVPVVLLLSMTVLLIAFSINVVKEGCISVPLNSKNETVNTKVYGEGTHVISPAHHFAFGLPAKGSPWVNYVQSESFTVSKSSDPEEGTSHLGVYIVFQFYVEESKAYEYYEAIPKTYAAGEYEILTGFNKIAKPIVDGLLNKYTCAEYYDNYTESNTEPHEVLWIGKFKEDFKELFKGQPFTLDEEDPIKAIFFFDGCGFN